MSLGQRHWTTRLISHVLCCTIFLQTGTLAAGYLPAPPERREWVSDERLAALVDVIESGLPLETAEPAATAPKPRPEPVRIAALQERPAPPKVSPSSILTDAADEAAIPAVRPKPPVEEREEPSAPVEIRPEDLPPFPPGMDGAVLPRAPAMAAGAPQALTASSLIPGWNLASVQNQPVDKNPASVFSSIAGKLTRVFAYDACTPADPWKVYDPADAPGSDLTQVDQKIGFWIEMTAPASVPNPGSLANETTIHLCVGWNLIGFPAGQARPVRTALSSIEGKYTRVFGFDPSDAADPWELYDVAVPSWANDLELMQPGRGYWVLATAETDLEISNVGAEPEVAITAPADLGVVTAPTDVIGTVRSDRLQEWTLSYRAHGEADAVVFASGNTPVVNGRLATFDPTLLLNGGYTVELTAMDFNGQSSTVEVDVNVEGQMKIGNFTLSFLDLEIPLSGLPIQVYRNYDSRDKRRGDFGIGWTLELKQGSYKNNRRPGQGWQISSGFLPCQSIQETQSHVTTIRLSDREVYRFRARLASPAPTLGGCFAQARFDFVDGPVPGATLAILGNTEVIYQNATNYVVDSGSFEIYEPQQVRLTTRDGRIFDLHLQQGVTRLQDSNGNTLSITSTSITHSSGLSVAFQRDGLGRITSITDAEGESLTYGYDSAGDLVAATDRESNTTRFSYAANHHLLEIEDALGRQPVRNEYDASGRLIRTTDSAGKSIELDHRLGDRQEVVTDRLGNTRLLEYDGLGNVIREVDANGKETRRTFDAEGRVLTQTDPLGLTRGYAYSATGDVTSITDPDGSRTSYTYNGRGQVLTILDPRGKLIANVYDAAGNLASITDPLGNQTTLTYDSRGNLQSLTDPQGAVTQYEHDAQGRITREVDALGTETTYTYDSNGKRLTKTTGRTTPSGPETLTWSFEYDRLGRLTRTVDPDGTSTQTVFDPLGAVLATVDKLGRRTAHTYDASGRLVRTVYPDSTEQTFTYDAEGRELTWTNEAGRTTRYEYDAVGRLVKTTHPDGATSTNILDDAGRLIAITDARGHTTEYTYDENGRRTKVKDALGNLILTAFDAAGNQVSVTDARGATTYYEYDDGNRLVRIRLPDGTEQEITYDRAGRKVSEADPAGRATRFGYDLLGRLTSVTDALGQVTRYVYDEQGNRISQTDANGHTVSFEYDKLGRLIKRTLPPGLSETRAYDAAGNLVQRADFNGAAVAYQYDARHRLIRRSYPDGSTASFTYTPTGKRASVIDARGTTAYGYDLRDRLVQLTDPTGASLGYTYDAQGNRTALSASIGASTLTTAYTFDPLDRLETVIDPQGRTYSYSYDANGNRASLALPNGLTASYTYDSLNRLLDLTTSNGVGAVVQSFAYTLGPIGNRTRVVEHDGTVRSYDYDTIYRLTSETITGGPGPVYQNIFTYDTVGNRLTRERTDAGGTVSTSYSYDERDRLLSETGATYAWDANGNLITKSASDGASYTWDFDNRLVRTAKPDGTVISITYDADGNRVRTEITPPTGPPTVTRYVVDPSSELSQVVAETDDAGNLLNYWVRGDDLLAVIRSSGTRFYHLDGLGSVRALTDEAGTVTDTYTFSAFGELLVHTGSDPNAYLFAGEPLDPNSGYYYLRARWMDPGVGRFISQDPFSGFISDPPSLHKYTYVRNRPTTLVDPSGQFEGLAGLAVSAAIGAVVNAAINYDSRAPLSKVGVDLAIGALEGMAFHGLAVGAIWTISKLARLAVNLGRSARLLHLERLIERVLSNVANPGPFWPGTQVPRFFTFRTALGDVFLPPNATKHLAELALSKNAAAATRMTYALLLKNLESAITKAALSSFRYGQVIVYEGWELIFVIESKAAGGLVSLVLKHARYIG